jgi:SAM-dependent methyltransferase
MDDKQLSWAVDRPVTSPFAFPRGLRGRLAGRFMLWSNRQDEVVTALAVRPGDHVLEIGYGPGGLIRLLAGRTEAAQIRGVDPATAMREVATSVNRKAIRAGRVTLGLGSAADTGLPAQSVDRVVSVNNVPIWPDLEAGVREAHRVLRPGGTVLIAWHGGTSPSRIAAGLRLPEEKLQRIERALTSVFGEVGRTQLTSLDVFTATR